MGYAICLCLVTIGVVNIKHKSGFLFSVLFPGPAFTLHVYAAEVLQFFH